MRLRLEALEDQEGPDRVKRGVVGERHRLGVFPGAHRQARGLEVALGPRQLLLGPGFLIGSGHTGTPSLSTSRANRRSSVRIWAKRSGERVSGERTMLCLIMSAAASSATTPSSW